MKYLKGHHQNNQMDFKLIFIFLLYYLGLALITGFPKIVNQT